MIIDSHAVHTEKDLVDATGSKKVVKSISIRGCQGSNFYWVQDLWKLKLKQTNPYLRRTTERRLNSMKVLKVSQYNYALTRQTFLSYVPNYAWGRRQHQWIWWSVMESCRKWSDRNCRFGSFRKLIYKLLLMLERVLKFNRQHVNSFKWVWIQHHLPDIL